MVQHRSTRTWTARLAALVGVGGTRRSEVNARNRRRARPQLELLEDRCVPATITVNSNADTAAPPTGTITLRSAITQAEADTTPDTITFAASVFGQTITLGGTALPTLTKGETITGPGVEALTVNANNASRIFVVTSTTNVTISGLMLTGGNAGAGNNGGAILNNGLLTLTSDTFTNNTAPTGSGGAVANVGATAQLTVNTCTFTQNSAGTAVPLGGGAIYSTTAGAQLTVNNSTFSSNTGAYNGGAIRNDTGTTATITGATITGNSAKNGGNGGGIENEGTLTVTNSTIAFNTGSGGNFFGGGIANFSSLSLLQSAVYGNLTEGEGGGVFTDGTVCNITNTTIANNTALDDGGGGGIYITGASASLALLNDTITGNVDASASATNGGGVSFNGSTFTINNSIVALNHATGAGAPPDIRGAVNSGVNNFIGIGTAALTGITNGTNGNQIGTTATPIDPRLGPLQNNGGPTLSEEPLAVSPATAINLGNNAAAAGLTTDQRGSPRLVGTAVDIGSVEFQPPDITFTLTVTSGGNPVTQVPANKPVTLTATVTPTAAAPNAPPTGTVTFMSGATVLGTATVTNGVATLTLAKPPIGHLSIVAQYSGDLNYPATSTAPFALFVVPQFTVGAYDPLLGNWSLRSANSSGPADAGSFQFGGFGPAGFADGLVGDWAGTGQFTPAVFYPASGTWFLRTSNGPTNALVVPAFPFGGQTTIPIAGDWFGDGHFDVGVYDVTSGTFFLRHGTNTGAVTTFQLGGPGFYPIAGDFTGSGTWTVGVVQLSTMTWYIKTSNTPGGANIIFQWGTPNPAGFAAVLPVVGDWGGSGHYGVGLVVPVQNQPNSPFNNQDIYLLRNEVSAGFADAGFFAFGAAGDTPVAGQWTLPTNPLSYQLAAGEGPGAASLTQAQLSAAVAAALARLQQSGVSQGELARLASASYQLAALPAGQLGYTAQGVVQISADGAGHGWFVDPTPGQDEEFSGGSAYAGSAAAGKEDLLTVVLHEMAHLIGVNDGGTGLMATVLPTGVRRTAGIDAVFGGAELAPWQLGPRRSRTQRPARPYSLRWSRIEPGGAAPPFLDAKKKSSEVGGKMLDNVPSVPNNLSIHFTDTRPLRKLWRSNHLFHPRPGSAWR